MKLITLYTNPEKSSTDREKRIEEREYGREDEGKRMGRGERGERRDKRGERMLAGKEWKHGGH